MNLIRLGLSIFSLIKVRGSTLIPSTTVIMFFADSEGRRRELGFFLKNTKKIISMIREANNKGRRII